MNLLLLALLLAVVPPELWKSDVKGQVACQPDGRWVAVDEAGQVGILDGATGRPVTTLSGSVSEMQPVQGGLFLATSQRAWVVEDKGWKTLRHWTCVADPKERGTYRSISADGKVFATAVDGGPFHVYGGSPATWSGELGNFFSTNWIQLSPDGAALVTNNAHYSGSRGIVQVAGKAARPLPEPQTGRLVAGVLALLGKKSLALVDRATMKALAPVHALPFDPSTVTASRDGKVLLVSDGGRRYSLLAAGSLKPIPLPTDLGGNPKLAADGSRVGADHNGEVAIWTRATGQTFRWKAGGALVGLTTNGLAFTRSGPTLRAWKL